MIRQKKLLKVFQQWVRFKSNGKNWSLPVSAVSTNSTTFSTSTAVNDHSTMISWNQGKRAVYNENIDINTVDSSWNVSNFSYSRSISPTLFESTANLTSTKRPLASTSSQIKPKIKPSESKDLKPDVNIEYLSSVLEVVTHESFAEATPAELDELKDLVIEMDCKNFSSNFSSYCDYVYILSRLKVSWKSLSEEVKEDIVAQLPSFGDVMQLDLTAAEKLVRGLHYLLIQKNQLRSQRSDVKEYYKKLLIRLLKEKYTQTPKTTTTDLATILAEQSKKQEIPIAFSILCQLKQLSNKSFSLSQDQIELIIKGLEKEWNQTHESMKYVAVYMLGELSIDYRTLPSSLWSRILHDITKDIVVVEAAALSSVLKGWFRMGYRWHDMDQRLREAILQSASKLFLQRNSSHGVGNVVLYLGELGIDWMKDLSDKNREEMLEGIRRSSRYFTTHGIANTLIGLSKMQVQRKQIPEKIQLAFYRSLELMSVNFNEQQLSNIFNSLGKLGWKWFDLPAQTQKLLIERLEALVVDHSFSILALDTSLYGFTLLEYNWKGEVELKQGVLRRIEQAFAVREEIRKESIDTVAALIYGLGKTSLQWDELESSTTDALINGIQMYLAEEKISPKKVCNLFYGLGRMVASVGQLPERVKSDVDAAVIRIEQMNYNSQDVSNLVRSFARMRYAWSKDFSEQSRRSLYRMVKRACEDFNPLGLSLTMSSLARLYEQSGESIDWEKEGEAVVSMHQSLMQRYAILRKDNADFPPLEMNHIELYKRLMQTLPSSLNISFEPREGT